MVIYIIPKQKLLRGIQTQTIGAILNGHRIVHIPYLLQLDTESFTYLFGADWPKDFLQEVTISTDYPHGFKDIKCLLPSDFSVLGTARFLREFNSIKREKANIASAIVESLKDKIVRLSYMEVLGEIKISDLEK